MSRYKTKREAAEAWVREFDAIPQGMISELMEHNPYGWHEVTISEEDDEPYDILPAWGTMWSFHDWCDNGWFEYEYDEAIKAMSECGFRVYESDDYGYFFGIDGAGYDFYEAHWIPLYEARGLQWHEDDDDE